MPALGAAAIDGVDQLAVGIEFVDPEHRDLGDFGVPRRFRRVRHDRPEAAAVAQEILDLELLVAHHQDVVVEPGLVDRRESPIVERLDVDAGDLDADLRAHAANLDHRSLLRRSTAGMLRLRFARRVKPRIAIVAMHRTR